MIPEWILDEWKYETDREWLSNMKDPSITPKEKFNETFYPNKNESNK